MKTSWLDLNGSVIVVTGGCSGIGEKIVETLHYNNAQVVVIDQSPAPANALPGVSYYRANITDAKSVQSTVDAIRQDCGRIDGWINNAGVNRPRLLVDYYRKAPGFELSEEDYDFMVNVNQKGVYLCSQSAARVMVEQASGVIVNIASEAGIEGSRGQSCYAATKAAVHAFTLSWAKELGKYNIRVVGVAPGINEQTPMGGIEYQTALAYTRGMEVGDIKGNYSEKLPLGRPGKLSEIADLCSFLVSNHASYITGTTINITGGKSKG